MTPADELILAPKPRVARYVGGHSAAPAEVRVVGELGKEAAELLQKRAGVRGSTSPAAVPLMLSIDQRASAHPQGYVLSVRADGMQLRAGRTDGLRHGLQTLAQILRQGRAIGRVPEVEIEDWPSVARRGVMLDVSRDRVPTMESLLQAIDDLAHLKVNHLQLYTEHTFAYAGHEDVWREADPITPAELRELDTYASARGIELAANQNTLGHMHRWLKHPRYTPLAEITGDWVFETDDGRSVPKSGPFSLCPTDSRSIALVRDLLGQLLPCVAGVRANVGLDEAYDVGQGRSRGTLLARAGLTHERESPERWRRAKGELFYEHLNAVALAAREHGKAIQFWADIAMRHPDLLERLPTDAEAMIWGYEGDAPFNRQAQELASRGVPFWTCPGTSAWLSITGRTSVRHANLRGAVRAAITHRGAGVLVTNWGDHGHRQQWPIELHALAHGACAMWSGDHESAFDPRAVGVHLFTTEPIESDATLARAARIGPWLESLGDADDDLRGSLRNTSPLHVELHRAVPLSAATGDHAEPWRAVATKIGGLIGELGENSSVIGPLFAEEMKHAAHTALLAAEKAAIDRTTPADPAARAALAQRWRDLIDQRGALWRRRYREGGLSDSLAHDHAVLHAMARG